MDLAIKQKHQKALETAMANSRLANGMSDLLRRTIA
jgi:hypothetical protein